jgi:hypothetical protein
MWVKERIERNKKNGGSVRSEHLRMPGPIKEYEQLLTKSCAGSDAAAVPNAVVISADANGRSRP